MKSVAILLRAVNLVYMLALGLGMAALFSSVQATLGSFLVWALLLVVGSVGLCPALFAIERERPNVESFALWSSMLILCFLATAFTVMLISRPLTLDTLVGCAVVALLALPSALNTWALSRERALRAGSNNSFKPRPLRGSA